MSARPQYPRRAAIWMMALASAGVGLFGLFGLAQTRQGSAAPTTTTATAAGPGVWGYGGGPQQIRYSNLTQITKANVGQLQVAWTYDTGETGAMQTQPLVVGGVLYGYTPTHKTFAGR